MEEEQQPVKYYKGKNHNKRYNNININTSSPRRIGRSFDNTLNKNTRNQNFASSNINSNNYKNKFNLDKNINLSRPLEKSFQANTSTNCPLQCPSILCPLIGHCNLHHIHYHHIHVPHSHFCPRLNYSPSYKKAEKRKTNDDLLNEVAELRDECRKFKAELEKTKNDNKVESKLK